MNPEMLFTDSMVLGAGHSLMTSHTPPGLNAQIFSDNFIESSNVKENHDSFGLFGGSINYNTFYKDADSSDFNPEEDEFIQPVFRMLSAVVVAKGYNPTDFSEGNILKNSMHLLKGQTVNCDHETDVGNAIGAISEVAWQNAYTDASGIKIPAGINAKLKIDAKSNPRIARGINMDPPSIHSNSVTVQFEWRPSHTFETEFEFWQKLGTYDDKGELVRRIVTKIISYKETSLVSHGADPFAQIIKDGKIINPAYAGSQYYNLSEDRQKEVANDLKNKMYSLDYKTYTDELHNTMDSLFVGKQEPQKNTLSNNMEQLEQFLESLFGEGLLTLSGDNKPTSELVVSQLKELVTKTAKTAAENSTLSAEITSLKEKNKKMEVMSNLGETYLKDVRDNAIASYTRLQGDKLDTNIVSLLNAETTTLETLKALGASYEVQLTEKFPHKCDDCGSTNVTRASSVKEEEGKPSTTKNKESDNIIDTLERLAEAKRTKEETK